MDTTTSAATTPTGKKVLGIYTSAPPHWVGDGFPVRTLFDYEGRGRALSPFLMLDHAAPTPFAPAARPRGVGPHPHRGFETVTIVYQGAIEHRDSAGGGGRIGPGDVQWMTAGAGILHDEFHAADFTASGGTLEMVQLWVNLPARDKMAALHEPPGRSQGESRSAKHGGYSSEPAGPLPRRQRSCDAD